MANEIYKGPTYPLSQELQNIESNTNENQGINTKLIETLKFDSKSDLKYEQGQLPHVLAEILGKRIDFHKSQNNSNFASLLESKEINPNISNTYEIHKLIKVQAIFRGYIIRKTIEHKETQNSIQFLTIFTDFQKFNANFSEWMSPQIICNLERQEMYFSYFEIFSLSWTGPVFIDDLSIYYGEVDQNFKPHGKGILISLEYICEGNWLLGKMEGLGRKIDKTGTYTGNWSQGVRDGKGTMKYLDGRIYFGYWKNDIINGYGEVVSKDINSIGYYKDGIQYGQGTFVAKNKYIYEGSFVNGLNEGYGTVVYSDGENYKGFFKNAKYHGIGILYQSNGWKYVGDWDSGNRHGLGEASHPTKGSYKCMWENNKPIGKYTYIDPNNNILKGLWTDIGHINYLDEIIPHLFLGSAEAAEDEDMLKNLGVFAILRVLDSEKVALIPGFVYHYIKIKDLKTENIEKFIPEAYKFVDEWLEKGKKVLVHCRKGISRSATMVIAYIMIKKRINFDEALKMVRNKRPLANPNMGFIEMLKSHYDMSKNKISL